MLKTRIFKILKRVLIVPPRFLREGIVISKAWYGNNYGGFYVHPDVIDDSSIVYSVGIGEDISFDLDVIDKHKSNVYGFDPTPKSINWVSFQEHMPNSFKFSRIGIGAVSGDADFFTHNSDHVSGSSVLQKTVGVKNSTRVL